MVASPRCTPSRRPCEAPRPALLGPPHVLLEGSPGLPAMTASQVGSCLGAPTFFLRGCGPRLSRGVPVSVRAEPAWTELLLAALHLLCWSVQMLWSSDLSVPAGVRVEVTGHAAGHGTQGKPADLQGQARSLPWASSGSRAATVGRGAEARTRVGAQQILRGVRMARGHQEGLSRDGRHPVTPHDEGWGSGGSACPPQYRSTLGKRAVARRSAVRPAEWGYEGGSARPASAPVLGPTRVGRPLQSCGCDKGQDWTGGLSLQLAGEVAAHVDSLVTLAPARRERLGEVLHTWALGHRKQSRPGSPVPMFVPGQFWLKEGLIISLWDSGHVGSVTNVGEVPTGS